MLKETQSPGVAIDFAVTTDKGVAYVTVTTDEAGSAIVTKTVKVKADAAGTEVDAELPVSFAEGTVVKYRLVKSHATDGKDVEFVGEFKVSGDCIQMQISLSMKFVIQM